MTQVATFLANSIKAFVSAMANDWGILGLGLIACFILDRVVNFIKRFFH